MPLVSLCFIKLVLIVLETNLLCIEILQQCLKTKYQNLTIKCGSVVQIVF